MAYRMASREAVRAIADAIIFGPQRFIDRTFDDALSLLQEVRSYILYEERSDRMGLPPAARVRSEPWGHSHDSAPDQRHGLATSAKSRCCRRNRRAGAFEGRKPLRRSGSHASMMQVWKIPVYQIACVSSLIAVSRVYVRAARLDDMIQGEQVAQYGRCIRWRSGDTDPRA